MKKLIYLFLMVAGTTFAQKNTISVSSAEYDQLKSNQQLTPGKIYQFSDLVPPSNEKPSSNPTKNALCSCLLTLDNTYSLAMAPNDDGSSSFIQLPFSFDFYGTLYDSVIINNNGNISFLAPYFEFTANPFPDPNYNMIAPFWGDVDTRALNGGNVWYKVTNDALIVIWDHVGYFNTHDSLTNTFQLVISNGQDTIIHGNNNISFCYGDMQWTTGDASAGVGGFGGSAATVGVNIGNGVDFFQVGQFDAAGTSFDGPYAFPDQVDFLDDQEVYFDVAGMNAANIAPLVINSNICDTIDVYTGDTLHKSMDIAEFTLSLLTPEFGQELTYSLYSDEPSAFTYQETVASGDYIQLECAFHAQGVAPDLYFIHLNVTDNGAPVEHTSVSIPVKVHFQEFAGQNELEIDELSVYPNPSNGNFTISSKVTLQEIEVVAIDGTIVAQSTPYATMVHMDPVSPGSYLVKTTSIEGKSRVIRLEILP